VKQEAHRLPTSYSLLLINSGLSRFGVSTFNLVIIWVILQATHNAFLGGLGDGVLSLPLFLSYAVGVIVDRSNKKKALAALSGIARSLSLGAVFIGIMLRSTLLLLISLYSTAFIIGFTSDVMNAVRAVWTKEFLAPELYKRGSSAASSVYSIAEGAGYVSSGLLLALGVTESFIFILVFFTLAVVPILFIHPTKTGSNSGSAMSSIREGLGFILKNKPIWQAMVISFLGNLVFGMAGIIYISLIQLGYKLPALYVSLVFGTFILGIVGGSSLAQKVKGKVGRIALVGYMLMGGLLASVSSIREVYLVLVPSFLIGLIIGVINVVFTTAFLKLVPKELMARVQGAFNTFSLAITSLSGMLGGIVIQLVGPSDSFLLLGGVVLISSPLFAVFKELSQIVV